MAINAPFGLSMNFPDRWAGRDFGAGPTNLHTYNATPSIAYRINDWISVGAGVQIQYATEVVTLGLGQTPGLQAVIKGNGWGYGFTAGATLTPTPTTTIGIGWRSFIDQKIDSTLSTSLRGTRDDNRSGQHDCESPRHRVAWHSPAPRSALDSHGNGGMVELESHRHLDCGRRQVGLPRSATIPVAFPFQYKDGWFFSGGAEYKWTDRLTVRGGIGYEISPVTDQVRMPLVPDNDRFWASVGATWQVFKGLHFDLAYSHIWVKDPSINISAASGNPWFIPGVTAPYVGSVKCARRHFVGCARLPLG